MFARIIIASILLVAVNAAGYVPGLETVREWAPAVSVVIGLYLLLQGFAFRSAAAVPAASKPAAAAAEPAPPPAAPETRDTAPETRAHLAQFVGLLQEKGRFLDFVMDDIAGYSNEQVGAAARVVHQGCAKVVREHFSVAPVSGESEGNPVTLEAGYNAAEFRVVGKLGDSPPFHGTLLHKGWKAEKIELPRLVEKPVGDDKAFVIAPAEVEVKG